MPWATWKYCSEKSKMTANNSSPVDLSVAHTTSLLERLGGTLSELAAGEEVLLKEARTRRLTLERRQGEAVAAFDQQFAKEAGAIDATWLGRWDHTRRHHEQRMFRIEKAERNVLPTLNNLLENREMALDDGSFLVSPARYDALAAKLTATELARKNLLRVHPSFRVIALGLPVPRFPGYPRHPPA